jgi:hypothetical protein
MPMKCPKCEREIPDGDQSCPHCGANLAGAAKAGERFVIQQDISQVREGSKVVRVEYHEASKLNWLADDYTPPAPPPKGELAAPGGLPPGARMPFNRNTQFTGRERELLGLAEVLLYSPKDRLAVGVTQAKAAITGLGGMGKTQLAVEFCYRYGRFFQGVHWVQANQEMQAEVAACGAAMGIQP